jgi:hypothetical protein
MATRIIRLAFCAALLAAPAPALAQRLQLDALDRLAERASESVNIDIDPAMLQFALPFLKGGANEQEVKALVAQLKGIYVRVFEFNQDIDTSSEVSAIRKQLTSPWARLISVDDKQGRELVEIYSWRQGDASGGLAILVAESNELTVVNIVGPIDISKLGALRGLGVPDGIPGLGR